MKSPEKTNSYEEIAELLDSIICDLDRATHATIEAEKSLRIYKEASPIPSNLDLDLISELLTTIYDRAKENDREIVVTIRCLAFALGVELHD
jgi:hypothetical protein